MSETYKTVFINSSKAPYVIYENGQPMETVFSNSAVSIESESPATMYARWSEVLIKRTGIVLHDRPGWQEPERTGYVVELLNVDGNHPERRFIGGREVVLPRGIPVFVSIELGDPLIWFEKITIKKVSQRVRNEQYPGYFLREIVLRDEKTERSHSEQHKILDEMEKLENFIPPEKALLAEPEEGPVYVCEFENKRDPKLKDENGNDRNPTAKIFYDSGKPFFSVEAGAKVALESWDEKCIYSRFTKITFFDDAVSCEENKKWKCPYEGYVIELENVDSRAIQGVTIFDGFQPKHCQAVQGIPVLIPIHFNDPNCIYKKISWKNIKVKRQRQGFSGYVTETLELQQIKELRSKKEIDKIKEAREKYLIESYERNRKTQMKYYRKSEEAFSHE